MPAPSRSGMKPPTKSWQEVSGERKKTPSQWSTPKDGRTYQGAGVYPNYHIMKGVSGDVFMADRSAGNESYTWQGPDGQGWQFKYDGSTQFIAHNGHYQVTFGEQRMMITGAQDITARGGGSLRVQGDYNVTADGDMNFSGSGNMNIVANGMNVAVGENFDVSSATTSMKSSGSATIQSSQGAVQVSGKTGASLVSSGGPASVGGASGVNVGSGADMTLEAKGEMNTKSGGNNNTEAPQITQNTSGATKPLRQQEPKTYKSRQGTPFQMRVPGRVPGSGVGS